MTPKFKTYRKKLYSRRRVERPLLFALAFDNGLADRKSASKSFNGNKQATSSPNLVNFRPAVSEFSLLKRAIFAAIRPQFYDVLPSSRRRSKTASKRLCIPRRTLWRYTNVVLFSPLGKVAGRAI